MDEWKTIEPGVWKPEKESEQITGRITSYNVCYTKLLREKEIQDTIMKSLDKKDYHYGCKNEPLASFCNAKKCRNQKFGIGKGHIPIVIEEIQIYQTEPRITSYNVCYTKLLREKEEEDK